MPAPSRIRIAKRGHRLVISTRPAKATVAKFDMERQIVFGWANVCVECSGEQIVDSHEDMIDPDELETAAYNFVLNFGDMGEDHRGFVKGRLIESMFFTPEKLALIGLKKDAVDTGWWVGFHVKDRRAWERVKRGDHRMFSIQGVARREEVQ